MSEFSQWRAEAKPSRVKVAVCFDGELQADLEQAEDSLRDLERQRGKMLGSQEGQLRDRIARLQKEIKAKTRILVFKGIGRRAWNNLVNDYPPTDEQLKDAESKGGTLQFNPETFPVAAMEKTCVEPGLSAEDAQWLFDELSDGDFMKVWDACLRANVAAGRNPFDPVSATQNGSATKSKPRSESASRTRSS